MAQISFIPVVSAHCEQFIKYDCKGSLLFRPDDPATGWWVSRNGIQLLYSGGASPVDFKKCGTSLKSSFCDTTKVSSIYQSTPSAKH